MPRPHTRSAPALAALLAALPSAALAQQVISAPATFTGASAIDPLTAPLSGRDISRVSNFTGSTGFTSEAALEALDGFRTVQTFAFTGNQTTTPYGFDFATGPDIRITLDSAGTGSAVQITNNDFTSSNGSALRVQSAANGSISLRIDFGSWSGSSFTLASGTTHTVAAAGFTLTGRFNQLVSNSLSVTYYNSAGVALSTQSFASSFLSGDTTTTAGFTGHQTAGGDIAYIIANFTAAGSGSNAVLFGLDDLGFAPIPEPSAFAALAGLGALALAATRRRPAHRL